MRYSVVAEGDAAAMGAEAPTPPRRGRPKAVPKTAAAPKAKPAPDSIPLVELRKAVAQWHISVGMAVAMAPKYRELGMAFVLDSETAAEAWIDQARKSPKMRRALESMVRAGTGFNMIKAYGHVILASLVLAKPDAADTINQLAPFLFGPADDPADSKSDDDIAA